MKRLQARLAAALETNGWQLLEHANDLEWWADEIWQLTSRWSPAGTIGFITFLVDPMWEGERRKGTAVWAVGCSACYPRNRDEACADGFLRLQALQEDLETFWNTVNDLRNRGRI